MTSVAVQSGILVQRSSQLITASMTGTGVFTLDDSIPQNTHGDQYFSITHTALNPNNKLILTCEAELSNSSSGVEMFMGLFQDSIANALAAKAWLNQSNGHMWPGLLRHEIAAVGSISPIAFKIRIGGTSGTTNLNGIGGTRIFGGVCASNFIIEEYTK